MCHHQPLKPRQQNLVRGSSAHKGLTNSALGTRRTIGGHAPKQSIRRRRTRAN